MKLDRVNIVEKEEVWNMYGHVIGDNYNFLGKRDTVIIEKGERPSNKEIIDFVIRNVSDHKATVKTLMTGYFIHDYDGEVKHDPKGIPHRTVEYFNSLMHILTQTFDITQGEDVETFVLKKHLSGSTFKEVKPFGTVDNLRLQ